MNIYYSLPDSVIYKINKIVFSTEILPEIKKIITPGDFSFMIPKETLTLQWDKLWVLILRDYYNFLYEIGEDAWKFIYKKRHYKLTIYFQSDEPIWQLIKNKLLLYGPVPFEKGLIIMQHISIKGWNKFVKDYSLINNN